MYSDQHKHFQMICPDIALLYRVCVCIYIYICMCVYMYIYIYIYIVIMLIRMTLDSSSLPGHVKKRFAYTLYSITTLVVITTNNVLNTQLLYHLKR